MAFATIDVTKGITGTLPTANGGTGATSFSPGKVLQVQEFNYTTYAARTDNSSFSDALHVDITPSASDSKIFITTAGQFSKSGVTEVIYRLYRQTGGSGDSGWTTAATRVGTDVGAWTGSTSQANHTLSLIHI